MGSEGQQRWSQRTVGDLWSRGLSEGTVIVVVPIGQTQLDSDEGLVSASRRSTILEAAALAWSNKKLV